MLDGTTASELLGEQIYPIVADADTTFPFAVYRRTGIIAQSDKDYRGEQINVDVICAALDYATSVECAEAVRSAIEGKSGTYGDIDVADVIVENANEDYVANTYIQTLSFRIMLEY